MIKAIIFDFFDVIRSDPSKAWFTHHGFKENTKLLDVVRQLDNGEISMGEYFKALSSASGQSEIEVREEFESVSQVNFEVVKLIKKLLTKYKVGLLSNASSQYIRDILRENDLEKYFNEIVISSEVGHTKPSKEIFEITLNRLRTNASEAIFIDDNMMNTDRAEKFGIRSVQFLSAQQLTQALSDLHII